MRIKFSFLLAILTAGITAACGSSTSSGGTGTGQDSSSTSDNGTLDTSPSDTASGDTTAADTKGTDASGDVAKPDTGIVTDVLNSLDNDLTQSMQALGAPGMSLAIVKGGKVAWSKAYGVADVDSQEAFTPQHLVRVGDLSQAVVALAVMQQVEAGTLSLSADINTYLPFKVTNPLHSGTITLGSLLSLTSGITDRSGLYDTTALPGDPTVLLADFDQSYFVTGGAEYASANFVNAAPNATYTYAYTAMALAAHVVQQVTKTPFETYTQTKIFAPLGMTSAVWFKKDIGTKPAAWPHGLDSSGNPSKYDDYTGVPYFPAVELYVSVPDFARLLACLTTGGTLDGKALIKKASADQIFTVQNPNATDVDGNDWSMGLAFGTVQADNGDFWNLVGVDWGFYCESWTKADFSVSVVQCFNIDLDPSDSTTVSNLGAITTSLLGQADSL